MKSKRIVFSLSFIVILAMALSACATSNQTGISNVSASGKVTAVSVSMDQLELGQTFFVGKVTSLAKDAITIDDVVFRVDQNSFLPSGLTVGDVVSVDGIVLPDQTRYAVQLDMRSVADISPDKEGLEFKLYGLVEAMEAQTWVISGETINVSQNAMIEPGIQLGDVVEVEGYLVNGTMRAYEITKESSSSSATSGANISQHEYEFYGLIESMGNSEWVIDGKTVQLNNQTEVKGSFSVGDFVKVHVLKETDGRFTAREIEHKSDDMENSSSGEHQSDDKEVEFKGFVEEIGTGMWVVAGVTILLGDNLKINETIQVGDYVEVEGYQQNDGSVLVYKIALESSGASSDDDDDSSDDDHSNSDDDSNDDDSNDDDSNDDDSNDDDSNDDSSDDDSNDDDSSDDDDSDDNDDDNDDDDDDDENDSDD